MSNGTVLRTEALPWRPTGPRAPIWWGMLLLVAIETTVFASLFTSYMYLRARALDWPPAGFDVPGLLLPSINTGVLVASSAAVFFASRAIKKGDQRGLRWGLAAGVALEIVFFTIKVIESADFGHGWGTHAYASIYWGISGLHTIHVLVAILMAAPATVLAFRGYYNEERYVGVQVISIYWQFVTAIWFGVFFVLYFVPRLL